MKNTITLILLFLTTAFYSQNGRVGGVVADSAENGPIPGATVFLKSATFSQGKATNDRGMFFFDSVPFGDYTLVVSSIGFKKRERKVKVSKPRNFLGKIIMNPSITKLGELDVEDKIPLVIIKGDTTEYNADAYKTNVDASTGDLVEKMPGITSKNGEISAQGEKVEQVLVDGKPYFGDDPKSALKNIPARIVQKVQVFDDESDEAKATGFKDGNTVKTINIITKPEYRNSKFGNVYAGYGTDERYDAGGNFNFFNDDQRVSIVGLYNNINKQNFSGEDLVGVSASNTGRRGPGNRGNISQSSNNFMVPQQNGIAKTAAFGINYQDTWGKKTDVIGSYFYNNSKTDAFENTLQTYFSNSEDNQLYNQTDSSFTENANRKITLQVKHKFSKTDELTFRTRASLQDNFGESFNFSNTSLGSNTLNSNNADFNSNLLGYNLNSKLFYNHRFKKRGRSIFLQAENTLFGNDGVSSLFSIQENRASIIDTLDQFSNLLVNTVTYKGKIRYTEPLGKGGLMFDANIEKTESITDNKTFGFSQLDQSYSSLTPEFSSQFESDILNQSYSIGYRFFSKKIFTFIRAQYQITDLKTSTVFPNTDNTSNLYQNILPFAMLKYTLSRSKNVFVMYRSYTRNPQVNQLQNFLDNSNPISLRIGNNNLQQAQYNMITARYINANTDKATTFFITGRFTFSNDYIGASSDFYSNDTTIRGVNLESGKILNSYTNLSGYRTASTYMSYGFPISKIKSNMNLDGSVTYIRTPSRVNSVDNLVNGMEYEIGAKLSSNISEKVDFLLSARASLNDFQNSNGGGNSTFLTQEFRAKATLTFPREFIFRTQANYQVNTGFSDDLNIDFLLWNASIAKKIFKNNKGEISLSVFDALRQNNLLDVSTSETYIEQIKSRSLQRYGMVTFTYTFSKFKKQEKDPMDQFYRRR